MTKIWKVIVNPKAGRGHGRRDWPEIMKLIEKAGLDYSVSFSERKYHAIELAKTAVSEGYRKFIAVGGDGTLHEVLNGICSQSEVPGKELTLAVIPVGTGNDWGKMNGIPDAYEGAVEIIKEGNCQLQDIAEVQSVKAGKNHLRYMLNIGGLAFDANVCHHYDRYKMDGLGGKKLYIRSLFKAFFGYTSRRLHIETDGKLFYDGKVFSTALGIGKYSGGGMIQTPEASPTDGLIDITVYRKIPKIVIVFNLARLYRGTIFNMSKVIHTKAKEISITSSPESRVEVDGEAVGVTPVNIKILPLAINIVRNKENNI